MAQGSIIGDFLLFLAPKLYVGFESLRFSGEYQRIWTARANLVRSNLLVRNIYLLVLRLPLMVLGL